MTDHLYMGTTATTTTTTHAMFGSPPIPVKIKKVVPATHYEISPIIFGMLKKNRDLPVMKSLSLLAKKAYCDVINPNKTVRCNLEQGHDRPEGGNSPFHGHMRYGELQSIWAPLQNALPFYLESGIEVVGQCILCGQTSIKILNPRNSLLIATNITDPSHWQCVMDPSHTFLLPKDSPIEDDFLLFQSQSLSPPPPPL